MSNIVQGMVWNVEFPNPIAKLIAVKLADWADDDGGTIFPAIGTVSKKTGVTRSTVCKWIAAMEHCGLLRVIERSLGGSRTDTTERAFDLDLLRKLSPTKKAPAELALVEVAIERSVIGREGAGKTVKVPVFEIVLAGAEDVSPADSTPSDDGRSTPVHAAGGSPPVRHTDGSEALTRPPRGLHPSAARTGTRPPHGPEPLDITTNYTSPPLPPSGGEREGGWAKRWSDQAREAVEDLRRSATRDHVATSFLDAVRGLLNPPSDVDGASYVRQLGHKLGEYPASVLSAAATAVLDTRDRDLPSVREIERLAEAAQRRLEAAGMYPRPETGPPDPELPIPDLAVAGRAENLRERIRTRLGRPVFDSWFKVLECEKFEGGKLTLSVPSKLHKTWIDRDYFEQLRECAAAEFEGLSQLVILVRSVRRRAA